MQKPTCMTGEFTLTMSMAPVPPRGAEHGMTNSPASRHEDPEEQTNPGVASEEQHEHRQQSLLRAPIPQAEMSDRRKPPDARESASRRS